MNELTLAARTVRDETLGGLVRTRVVRLRDLPVLDLLVDGVLVEQHVDAPEGVVSVLSGDATDRRTAALSLLGAAADPELAPKRVRLLVCGPCADLGCGALTARLSVDDSTVTWADLAWEAGDEDPSPVAGGPWVFDRTAYDALLRPLAG